MTQQWDLILDCLCAAAPHMEWTVTAWVFLKQILELYFKAEHDINSLLHTWVQTQFSYVTKYTKLSPCQYVSPSASHWATVIRAIKKPLDRFLRHIRLNNVVIPTPQALNELLLSGDFQGLWMVMCKWHIGIMCDTKCALWWRAYYIS